MTFDPDDGGLVKGMYIPLEYWRRLERTSAIQGRREGKLVTFENVRRYFDNTSFAQLVASGWIGTTAAQTGILKDVIREIVETGRTATFAIKRDLDTHTHGERRLINDSDVAGCGEETVPEAGVPPGIRDQGAWGAQGGWAVYGGRAKACTVVCIGRHRGEV